MAGNAESRAIAGGALKAAAVPVRDKMKANLEANGSVRTGLLHGEIKIGRQIGLRKTGYRIKIGVISNRAPHAHFVEFGHGGPKPAPPHEFMRPAYESTKDEAYAIIREKLKDAIFEYDGDLTPDVWNPSI